MPRAIAAFILGAAMSMTAEPTDVPPAASIVLGGGCFWCVEAAMEAVPGVISAESGYAGGAVDRPTYHQVCDGDTGHAEVVRVVYDPAQVGLPRLLELFFIVHDPTTKDRQGADVGTQYRSIILVASAEQRQAAEAARAAAQARHRAAIVTEIADLPTSGPGRFHLAEDYHQDYFRKNPTQAYCLATIPPKLDKLRKAMAQSGK